MPRIEAGLPWAEPAAERAYEILPTRSTERNVVNGAQSAIVTARPRVPASPYAPAAAGLSSEKLLDRARQAESAGQRGLALAYLRTARDSGSVEAGKKIDRLAACA